MPKMMIIDTYYPEAMADMACALSPDRITYDNILKCVLDFQFGTADFYSRHLREFGWEVVDVIANFERLQTQWAWERRLPSHDNVLDRQIEEFNPDVLFLQNLSVLGSKLEHYKHRYFMAAQCSCAIRRELVPHFKVIFTSFPHFVRRYGTQPYCKFIYNPLSFEPDVLTGMQYIPYAQRYDITFVGGVGAPSHWSKGMSLLHRVANEFENFMWWGYGQDQVSGPLRSAYQGHAWGRQMYEIYAHSKIVINRHGEIAQGYANNMRLFEATGCGALCMTEDAPNLGTLFELYNQPEVVTYNSSNDTIDRIRYYLDHPVEAHKIGTAGMVRTHAEHTYRERMKVISDALLEMM